MKNKGFTLTELLATISVMALIGLIIVPMVTKTIKKQRQNLYDIQVQTIIKAGEGWATKNIDLLPDDDVVEVYVGVDLLSSSGLLEKNDVIDPRNDEAITGCVAIEYESNYNQYTYHFINTTGTNEDVCLSNKYCQKLKSGNIECRNL